MTRAHEIYLATGFRRVPSPDHVPEALKPQVVFTELDLSPG